MVKYLLFTLLSLSITGGFISVVDYDELQGNIREGKISKDSAKRAFRRLMPEVKTYFYDNGGIDAPRETWIFPLQGYDYKSIGDGGRGYVSRGFDFFDGNRSTAHPAHDIFIRDNDQDDVDDVTQANVNIRSVSCGVVISVVRDWEPGSELRGGKSCVVYDPVSNGLFAYAHQSFVFSNIGDIVKPGDVLGLVGRTGKNAFAPRSPTHLHISYMKIGEDGLPRPENIYQDLVRAGRE